METKRWICRADAKPTFDRHCRWCRGLITEKRRTTFCSATCSYNYCLRSSPAFVKTQIYKRDKGICAACQTDTKMLAKELIAAGHETLPGYKRRRVWRRKWGGGLWDADHIVAVVNGGFPTANPSDTFSLSNFQTLCIPCHVEKTKQDLLEKKSYRDFAMDMMDNTMVKTPATTPVNNTAN